MDQLSAEDRKIVFHGQAEKLTGGHAVLVVRVDGRRDENCCAIDAEMPTDPVVTLSMRLPLAEGLLWLWFTR